MKNHTKIATVAVAGFMSVLFVSSSVLAHPAIKDNANKDRNQNHKPAKHLHIEKMINSKLDKLVADGTLTQDQANKITAKLKEMKNNLRQEKRSAKNEKRENIKNTIQTWLNDNNIDVELEKILPSRIDKQARSSN